MALTISAVADCKQIRLDKVDLRVEGQTAPDQTDAVSFDIQIDLGPGLTPREKTILLNSARSCEVGKILASEINFNYQLIPNDEYRGLLEVLDFGQGETG